MHSLKYTRLSAFQKLVQMQQRDPETQVDRRNHGGRVIGNRKAGILMKISGLGHVALKVTDMDRAKHFYHGVLGMPYSGEHEGNTTVFFRADGHHNLALFLSDIIDNTATSLDHIAFQLQGGQRELDLAQGELESVGIEVTPYKHQEVHSLYFNDPDGNQIDLYVHCAE